MCLQLIQSRWNGASALPWAVVVLLLSVGGAIRSQGLQDDRTWSDEDFVIVGTLGLYPDSPFPEVFTRSEIFSPSLRKCLDFLVRKTPYPPLQHVAVYAARNAANPILAVRWAFWILGLCVPLLVFLAARSVLSDWAALLPLALAVVSPALTLTSQQVKWYALAPLLATAAGLLLWMCCQETRVRDWVAYVGSVTLLLHVHYFGAFALPAHAIFVLTSAPKAWKRFALAWAAIGLLSAPWYLYALPSQLAYVKADFQAMTVSRDDLWSQPVTMPNVVAWQAYDGLMSLGLLPSPLRVRSLVPALLTGLLLVWLASHAKDRRRRNLARVGPITFVVALVGQTLYAVHVGNITPLSWTYSVPWAALVSLSLGIGLLEMSPRWRMLAGSVFVGLSLWGLSDHRFPEQISSTLSLSSYSRTVAFIESEMDPGTAVAYRHEMDAKKMSLFLKGPVLQLVGWPRATEPRVAAIDRILWVTPRGTSIASPDAGWSVPRHVATLGWTEVSLSCRPTRPSC